MRSPALVALALSLVHFVWQGALIAGALYIALVTLRRAPAASRYLCASAALSAMALAFVATFAFSYRELGMVALPVADTLPVRGAPFLWPISAGEGGVFEVASTTLSGTLALSFVLIAWWLGASVMVLRLAGGWLRVRSLAQGMGDVPSVDLVERAARLSRRMGIDRPVRLIESAAAAVPATVGWLRPVILLPVSLATRLSQAEIEAILAHELAHVRRHDYVINIAQSVIEALLFYHPAVHWVSRRIREERENCCDDAVVELFEDPLTYARALTNVEVFRAESLRLGLASNGGSLMSRIERLLNGPSAHHGSHGRAWALSTAVATSLLGAVAALAVACAGADRTQEPSAEAPAAAVSASLSIPWLPEQVTRWSPQIVAAANTHNVDPELLAIVMLVESHGNPQAKSPLGALGLMQVMPDTATKIAAERGLPAPSAVELAEPSVNLDYAAWFLARQIESFGTPDNLERSVELAAAAYNAGPKQLRAHLDEGAALSEETTRYKEMVLNLWRERRAPRSATLDAARSGGG